jgi:uncharacterized delta-60 repeat protein
MPVAGGNALLLPFVLLSFLAAPSWAKPGDLDPSFSRDGKVTTSFRVGDSEAYGLAIQPDGKIFAVGVVDGDRSQGFSRLGLARYNVNGTLDGTLSRDGRVTTDFTGGDDRGNDVAVLPGGRIVAVGEAGGRQFGLVRYWGNGSLDRTFGGDGKVTTNFGRGSDRAFGVTIQSDRKIIAVGRVAGSGGRFGLARYNRDGTLDVTFGGDGKVGTNFTSRNDVASDVALQPDGRIVAAGSAGSYQYSHGQFALARYNPDGTLDPTFGGTGKVVTDFNGNNEFALGVAIQSDEKIVIVGRAADVEDESNTDFALARYNPDGTLDASFGTGGQVRTEIVYGDSAEDVSIQADGKLVVAGTAETEFTVVRYNADGTLDSSFGDGGRVFIHFPVGFPPAAHALAIQSDGRIVAAGTTNQIDIGARFALVRLMAA